MENLGKLILRLAVGGLILFHGAHKLLHGIDQIAGSVEGHGLPGAAAYGVYVGEVLAPLLIIVGYWTRVGALVLAINMVVAIFLAHTGDIFKLAEGGAWGIELPMLYLLGAIAIALLGAGSLSLSRGRGRFD